MVPASQTIVVDRAVAAEPQGPLQERVGSCCADLAESFRALEAVSRQAATMLETGSGSPEDLYGLMRAFEQLELQAGSRLACLGAALSSAGSA